MIRVLAERHPDDIIQNTKSIIHFIDNEFHYNKSAAKTFTTTSATNIVDNYSGVSRVCSNSIDMFVKQISINKISFDFLSSSDLNIFLTAVLSTIDTYYTVSNVHESLNTFFQYIIGQSVFALRHCSLTNQNSLSSQPCIIISTLFLRIPPDAPSTFSIYRLIPLPIIRSGDLYVYSSLPKIIGINSTDHRIIIWKEEVDMTACIFSRLVQCQKIPMSVTLAKLSCLRQLLDNNQAATNLCYFTRSTDVEQNIMQVDDEFWLFLNIRRAQRCQVYSNSNNLV